MNTLKYTEYTVKDFAGSVINSDRDCSQEIKRRLRLGRAAKEELGKITKSCASLETKAKIMHNLIFPVTMYRCESWTVKKAHRKNMNLFEIWCWRAPWISPSGTAGKMSKWVLEQIKPETPLETKMAKLSYFGYTMRTQVSLQKAVVLGKTEGSRKRGRAYMGWTDSIKKLSV